MDTQKVFKSVFKALINEDCSIGIDIERYQGVLEYALSKVDSSVGTGIYMFPSNLKLNIGKTKGYNNKNFSEQHRHENWFKQRYKQGS